MLKMSLLTFSIKFVSQVFVAENEKLNLTSKVFDGTITHQFNLVDVDALILSTASCFLSGLI